MQAGAKVRDHRLYLELQEKDAMAFLSLGGIQDAVVIGMELGHVHFSDIHDTVERSRLYAARDAAVARISQAIEEAE